MAKTIAQGKKTTFEVLFALNFNFCLSSISAIYLIIKYYMKLEQNLINALASSYDML